jgi:hypothetical protein
MSTVCGLRFVASGGHMIASGGRVDHQHCSHHVDREPSTVAAGGNASKASVHHLTP